MNFLKNLKLVFVSISCALFLMACGGSDTPEGVAEDLVKAMAKADTDKVLKLIDTTGASAQEMEAIRPKLDMMLQQAKKELDAQGGLKSVKVVDKKISEDGNSATVTLSVETGKETKSTPIPLKKVDGKWKVSQK